MVRSSRHRPRPNGRAPFTNRWVNPVWLGTPFLCAALLLTACGRETPKPRAGSTAPDAPLHNASQQQAQRAATQERKAAEAKAAATALRRSWSEGHQSTVACLRGERAQTDGNELRCEEQAYVERNYPAASSR